MANGVAHRLNLGLGYEWSAVATGDANDPTHSTVLLEQGLGAWYRCERKLVSRGGSDAAWRGSSI
jgi:hypothetical protein